MKKLETVWELSKCDKDIRTEQTTLEKWHLKTCSLQGCRKTSTCLIKKKKKQYLPSTIKQSAINQGVSVDMQSLAHYQFKDCINKNHLQIFSKVWTLKGES